ncbi:MAG: GNAT family N-acetyltransferase [bacterium]
MELIIRQMKEDDAPIMSRAFTEIGWDKPISQYAKYFDEQKKGTRIVLVAIADGIFTGYLTIVWKPDYPYFRENNIPAIVDMNVLPQFRKKKIATRLMDKAEKIVAEKSDVIGIGVGLYDSYGPAQKMYVLRGYVPDGFGASYKNEYIQDGQRMVADDSLNLNLVKKIKK